jgi:hypothetical protein
MTTPKKAALVPKIRWTAAEIEALAKRSYMIRKNSVLDMSPLEAIRRAQHEVLAKDRMRDLVALNQVERVTAAWKLLESQGYGAGQQAIQPLAPPQHEPVAIKLEEVTTPDLLAEFTKRLTTMLDPEHIRALAREEVNRVLEARIPGMFLQPDHDPVHPEQKPEEAKQFHVCVLGLEGNQKESLRREYGSMIDFHFLDGSEGVNRIKATCEKMDLTVRSRWCKGNLGSTSGWPKFTSAEGGGLDTIKRLINQRFNL